MSLRAKQQVFVAEYLLDLNATQAAIRAGYSRATARQIGAENLSKPDIAAMIEEEVRQRATRNKLNADYVVRRLTSELEADLADLFYEDQTLKHVSDWPQVWRQGLVTGFSYKQGRAPDGALATNVAHLTFAPRIQQLELLGRHLGAF